MLLYFGMFIGHFGPAEALHKLNDTIPILPIAFGVSYPDLLWPILVFLKIEKVSIDKSSPLQNRVKFTKYPYSHSLVLSAALTLLPALILSLIYQRLTVGIFFFIAAISHWILDAIMHISDLPVLGLTNKDKKVGLGLWRHLPLAFFFEYGFFMLFTLLFTAAGKWPLLLFGALVFHLLNANSFFGFTKTNPTLTSNRYALLALVGYSVAIIWFNLAL
jgi:hypothetical protein